MIGLGEIGIILGVLVLIALFGRKTILKFVKDGFGIKKDIEKIKKESQKLD